MKKKISIVVIAICVVIIIGFVLAFTGVLDKHNEADIDKGYKITETDTGRTIEIEDENGEVHTILIENGDDKPNYVDMDEVDTDSDNSQDDKNNDDSGKKPAKNPDKKPGDKTEDKPGDKPEDKPGKDDPNMGTYEWYIALSSEKQYEYYKDFSSPSAFLKWYNKAKDEYESKKKAIEIKSGAAIEIPE